MTSLKHEALWTAKKRADLVLAILKGETSTAAAAMEHGVTASQIEDWTERFLRGAEQALREPVDPTPEARDEAIEQLRRRVRSLIENISPHSEPAHWE